MQFETFNFQRRCLPAIQHACCAYKDTAASKENLCRLRALRGELRPMKITKNIGMLLLAVYLIIDGLLGFGVNFGPAIFLLYLVALAAGFFILIGK
jgi:hypothetical protein